METTNEEILEELTAEAAEAEACEETAAAAEDNTSDKTAQELAQVKDQLLRTMAEYDNYRKRAVKEKDELRPIIISDVVKQFLPVMDNLSRALEAECSDPAYKQGVQMIDDSFLEILKGLGVEEIPSDGVMFDPTMHQAVQQVQSDELESGMVAGTFAKGYKIGDKVIRFAIVSVVS